MKKIECGEENWEIISEYGELGICKNNPILKGVKIKGFGGIKEVELKEICEFI